MTLTMLTLVSRSDDERSADLLAHHYHRVDHNQVWIIATKDIPASLVWLSGPDLSAGDTR
jgi:hypothetical protein